MTHPNPSPPHPARLAEAEAAPGGIDPAAARERAASTARAARQALAAVLAQRAEVLDATDAEVARLIDQAIARILQQLAAAPTEYELWVLPRLMDGIRRVADDLAAQVAVRASGGLRSAWELGERAVAAPLQAEAAALVATPAPAAASMSPAVAVAGLGQPSLLQLRAIQTFTTELITGATADVVKGISRTLGQVVLGAVSPYQALQTVAAALPEKAAHQVRAIVTSQLATAFNSAGYGALLKAAALDDGIKKQWRRSGKLHSRANHDAIDGDVRAVAEHFAVLTKKGSTARLLFPGDPAAPLGETINCGCVVVAWKATWKMKNPAGTMTGADRARRDAPRKRPRAPRPKPAATTPQQRALAAFGPTGTATDLTRQPVRANATLYPPTMGDPRLVAKGRDMASYWGVQTVKRPTEVWQQEHVNMGTGEIERTRTYVRRFVVGGTTWVGSAPFKWDGTAWAPTGPWGAQPAGSAVDVAMSRLRAGLRVWPKRG
jgi:hypothetical protein